MKTHTKILAFIIPLLIGLLVAPPLQAQTSYNLTVKSGPSRQSFEGFGVGSTSSWGNFDPVLREQMADMVYRDLKMNVLRMWIMTTTGTNPNPPLISVASMLSTFNTWYIANGYIDAVKARGITTLLLAPAQGGGHQPPGSVSDYATNLAELILQLKTTYNVQIDVTGISNEPGSWSGTQMAQCVNYLRSALDSRGLSYVKIVAPESSGACYAHPGMYQIDAMLADGTAWNNLYAIGSHSYGPLGDYEFENRKLDKQWWVTEAGADGKPDPEWAEDENFASWILEIFLNNMNHGVTEWIHFNGPRQVNDFSLTASDPTELVVADLKTKTLVTYLKYYYFKQALNTFDTGAIFRQCQSATEGDMLQQVGGQNPAINAAAAYNPDRSWGINIINTTGVTGTTATSTNLFYPATTYNVTLTVEELAGTPSKSFTVYRSRANNHIVQSGTVTLVNGVGTVSIAPRELVSLRSGASALTIPPVPGGLKYATVNDHLGLTWNNTVNATSWHVKRSTTSGGPYTTIATTTQTTYDDTSATNGTVYYYVVSAVNSLGESANSSELLATPAPFPWTNTDIGTVAITGSCVVNDNLSFTVWGSGTNIGGTAESFNYTYIPMSGNGTFIARLSKASIANTRVGIIMRETLDAAPKSSILFYNYNGVWNQVQMYNRTVAGNAGALTASSMTGSPMWLKLIRSGSNFAGYASTNGTAWTSIASANISMGTNIYAGLVVCACGTTETIRGYFDNISAPAVAPIGLTQLAATPGQVKVGWTASFGATSYNVKRATVSGGPYTTLGTVTSPTLSYTDTTATSGTNYYYAVSAVNAMGESANSTEYQAWTNLDVGTVTLSSSCTITASGTFTLKSTGTSAGGTVDSLNFTNRIMTGNGTIVVHLNSCDRANSKIGIAMRETLAVSPKASYLYYNYNGVWNQVHMCNRTVENNYGTAITSAVTGNPVWLKLVRSGSTFTGSASSDGSTWTTIGSATIPMANSIYVGLIDASSSATTYATALLDNLSVTTP